MFTASNMLQKYLMAQPRDMYDIVGALMGYINADPYFRTDDFDEAIKYVLSHGVTEAELFQKFDSGIDFQEDETKWNEDYYSYARVYLKDNFCKERIQHVKRVARKLHPIVKVSNINENTARSEAFHCSSQNESVRGGQQTAGKKLQDHQENYVTTQKHVVMRGLAVSCAIILMVVIVYIMRR